MEEIVIRRIQGGEFEQVFTLFSDTYQREIEITGLDVRRLRHMARFYSLGSPFFFFLRILQIDFETVLVAVSGSKVVGEMHLIPLGRRIWCLSSSAVDPQFRGRGIYRNLMKKAVKYIALRRGKKIVVTFRTDNPAPIKICRELKFEFSGEKNLLHLEISEVPSAGIRKDFLVKSVKQANIEQLSEICNLLGAKKVETYEVAFDDSLLSRLRNIIARIHSEEWILELEGKIVGYAGITYTSQQEAATIEPFYVLASKDSYELACALLRYLLISLLSKNIRKVNVSLNREWSEVIKAFQRFGFKHFDFLYEMEKNLAVDE